MPTRKASKTKKSATRKNSGKKFSCAAFVKRIHTAMKKKNPSVTMSDVGRRLNQLEKSISDKKSTF